MWFLYSQNFFLIMFLVAKVEPLNKGHIRIKFISTVPCKGLRDSVISNCVL